ncbi:MAG: penicillin acylase family protein, partial [Methylococcales bacterium]
GYRLIRAKALRFYAKGVNHAIEEFTVLPFEFLMLGYRPEPWRPEDTILVVLGMYVMWHSAEIGRGSDQ